MSHAWFIQDSLTFMQGLFQDLIKFNWGSSFSQALTVLHILHIVMPTNQYLYYRTNNILRPKDNNFFSGKWNFTLEAPSSYNYFSCGEGLISILKNDIDTLWFIHKVILYKGENCTDYQYWLGLLIGVKPWKQWLGLSTDSQWFIASI